MSEAATKLLEQLLQLPEGERRQIADRLRESLGDEQSTADDPEFQAELQRRLDAVAGGSAELIDGEQVFREARERVRRRRQP